MGEDNLCEKQYALAHNHMIAEVRIFSFNIYHFNVHTTVDHKMTQNHSCMKMAQQLKDTKKTFAV